VGGHLGGLRNLGGGLQNFAGPLSQNVNYIFGQLKPSRLTPLLGDLI
jgi:hypothetical protein